MAMFDGGLAYLRAATRDVVFGTDVRAFSQVAGADTDFSVTFTSTSTVTQTVRPFTNISNQTADSRTSYGWAFNQNEASVTSMGSISDRKRVISAGNWVFAFPWTSNAPALLANYSVVIEYSIYKVAANGGARSLLFSGNSPSTTVNLVAGSGTGAATIAAGEYIIEPLETIHVAVRVTSSATSAILGSVTNTVITFTGSGSGNLNVTTPNVRDLHIKQADGVGKAVAAPTKLIRKATIAGVGSSEGSVAKHTNFFRSQLATGSGVLSRELLVVIKSIEAQGKGAPSRTLSVSKSADTIGAGVGSRSNLVRKSLIDAAGEGVGDIAKVVTFIRNLEATGAGEHTFSRVVIFVRKLDGVGVATLRPRIALDWDDLPNPEGGGEIITYVRPLFIFDD